MTGQIAASEAVMAAKKNHFGTLDAMRGVAAICVMLFHYRVVLSGGGPSEGFIFPSGYLAVDLFFVLSGFVLAYAYDRRFESGLKFGPFLRIRIIRLMPMIWLGVAVGTLALLISQKFSVPRLALTSVLNLVLVPAATEPDVVFFPTNTPEWSIFYEMIANIVFALFLPFKRLRWVSLLALAGAVALIVFAPLHGSLREGETYDSMHVGFARVTFSFFAGVLLCRTRDHWQRFMPKLPPWLILGAVVLFLLVPASPALRPFYDIAFIILISPLIVMLGSVTEPSPKGQVTAVWLATLSYPLYALNQPFRLLLKQVSFHLNVPEPALAAVVAIGLIPASIIVAKVYDEPFRAFLTRITTPRSRERPSPAERAL